MFYDKAVAIKDIVQEPTLIFELIKEECFELVEEIMTKKLIPINTTDESGINVITKLLILKQYDLVEKLINNGELDINHQDNEGNTFGHYLANIDYKYVINIIKKLKKNKSFTPNIKNNMGETMLDASVKNNYLFTTVKILEDTRFDNIDIVSFKRLYETYIKSNDYGNYTKIMNLETIVGNLEKRNLLPSIKKIIDFIKDNYDLIKYDILNNTKKSNLDLLIHEVIYESNR